MTKKRSNGIMIAGLIALWTGIVLNSNYMKDRFNPSYEPSQNLEYQVQEQSEEVEVETRAADSRSIEDKVAIFAQYTAGFEGRRNKVYDARPNDSIYEPTIGVGHFLGRGDSRETFAKVLPEVNYDAVVKGEPLTNAQVDRLFASDIQKYVERAKKLVPNFDNFPTEVQTALVDMAYRGDLAGSPKTLALINKGKLREAANEYINSREYKTAAEKKMLGLKTRMDSNRERLLKYAEN